MNASHRRPLAAYVLVTVAGSVVVAQGLVTVMQVDPNTFLGRLFGAPETQTMVLNDRIEPVPAPTQDPAPTTPAASDALAPQLAFLDSIGATPVPQAEPEGEPVTAEPPAAPQPDSSGFGSTIVDDGAPAGPGGGDPDPGPGEDPGPIVEPGPGGLPVLTPDDDEPTEPPVPTEPAEPLPNPVDPPPTEEPPVEEPVDDPGIPPVVPDEPTEEPEEPAEPPAEEPEEPTEPPAEEPVVMPEPEEPVVAPEPEEPVDPECEAPQQEQPVVEPPVADEQEPQQDSEQDEQPAPTEPAGDEPAVLGRRG